jgi:hypothetical protein
VSYTLEYPDINPSIVSPDNNVVVNMPDVFGVAPTDYQIMEIILEITKGVFPVTVIIKDEAGETVFSVSVAV